MTDFHARLVQAVHDLPPEQRVTSPFRAPSQMVRQYPATYPHHLHRDLMNLFDTTQIELLDAAGRPTTVIPTDLPAQANNPIATRVQNAIARAARANEPEEPEF